MRPESAKPVVALRAEELQAGAAAHRVEQHRDERAAGARPLPGSGAAGVRQNGRPAPCPGRLVLGQRQPVQAADAGCRTGAGKRQ